MSRDRDADFAQRAKSAEQIASELFQTNPKPDWITFFREIFSVDGAVIRLFPNQKDVEKFHTTNEYHNIQQMFWQLRTEQPAPITIEGTQMITPRLPKSLHEFLIHEVAVLQSQGQKMSLNQLVITKLCVPYDNCLHS